MGNQSLDQPILWKAGDLVCKKICEELHSICAVIGFSKPESRV